MQVYLSLSLHTHIYIYAYLESVLLQVIRGKVICFCNFHVQVGRSPKSLEHRPANGLGAFVVPKSNGFGTNVRIS